MNNSISVIVIFTLLFANINISVSAKKDLISSAIKKLDAVGEINKIEGNLTNFTIKRKYGAEETVEVIPGRLLYPGDKVIVRGQNNWVELILQGKTQPFKVREDYKNTGIYIVEEFSSSKISDKFVTLLDNLIMFEWSFTAKSDNKKKARTGARGDDSLSSTSIDKLQKIYKNKIIYSKKQFIPDSLPFIHIIWQGTNARFVLAKYTNGYKNKDSVGGSQEYVVDNENPDLSSLTIQATNSEDDIFYSIYRIKEQDLPKPLWIVNTKELSKKEKVIWAVWVLENASPEYQLFAISLLSEQSESVYLAKVIFDAIQYQSEDIAAYIKD